MATQFTIVMAQLNLMVGDIDGNTERVIQATQQAMAEHNAALVVFPELALTGYPPEDLLLRPSMEKRIEKALEKLLAAKLNCYLIVGLPRWQDGKLFNSLAVIRAGEILLVYDKQSLPNYQVFDERRYFTSGDNLGTASVNDIRIAFTICEDIWEEGSAQQIKNSDAQLLININASPYHSNKIKERYELLSARSVAAACPIVYVNLVGGQDELVFDGASMVVCASGKQRYLAPPFQEGLYPVVIQTPAASNKPCTVPQQQLVPPASPEAEIYQALVLGVRDYVRKNNFPGVVLGLSGGIDSALSLAIAVDALGADKVHAVMMPSIHTSQLSMQVAMQQSKRLGVHYREIPIDTLYNTFMTALAEEFAGTKADTSEENIQARCRGVLMMAISNKKDLLVLTTGNKSEIAVGYATLYGDMAGGFDVLKDVPKTLVYRLAQYRNAIVNVNATTDTTINAKSQTKPDTDTNTSEVIPTAVIERPPSAELAPNQLDADSLPPYNILDKILELYVEQDYSADAIIAKGFKAADVKRVLRMVDLNEYKRQQSPIGVRLTRRGFGRDRRYPISNAWPLGE
ncbi:MAG: NAD+ synthase [Pseudohongiellaceae bacterium]